MRSDLVPGLPKVNADRIQLQQVLLNLLVNGMDAMDEIKDHRKELVIRVRSEDGNVVVRVEDSGKGLDEQTAQKIFTPFFTTKPHGIGLGLSISRSIIEAHEGRLWATPRPSGGAVFQFTLPASIRPDA